MYIYDKLFPFLGEMMGDEFEWVWLWQHSAAADSAIVTDGVKTAFQWDTISGKRKWCLYCSPDLMPPDIY